MSTLSLSSNSCPQEPYHFPFGSLVADGVDYLGLLCPHYKDAKNVRERVARLLARILSSGVFPFALALDAVYLSSASAVENMRYVLAKNPQQSALRYEVANSCAETRNKCLKGILAWPQNLFGADMLTMHFQTPGKSEALRPYGKLYRSDARIVHPGSVEEVIEIIKGAQEKKQKISIRGAGYSQGKQTLPPGDGDLCLDLDRFKKIEIDPLNKCAKVGAGVRWKELQDEADKHGFAILVQQASNPFSIGGSVGGANCHGWDHHWGSAGNTVLSMQVVKADGEVVTANRGDEIFSLVVGGYGLFGVIIELTLELTENVPLLAWAEKVELEKYIEYYRMIESNPSNYMHLYRLSIAPGRLLKEGYAQNYSVSNSNGRSTDRLVAEAPGGNLKERTMLQCARHFPAVIGLWWEHERKDMLALKKNTRNEIMRPAIEASFSNYSVSTTEWLQEYFLPAENLVEFVRYLGSILEKNEVKLLNCSVRPVIQDKYSLMGYARDGERFGVVLFFTQFLQQDYIDKTRNWVREVVDKVIEMKGTYYLPYMHFPTREQFQKCYPQHQEAVKLKQIYDPHSIFENQLYEYYR